MRGDIAMAVTATPLTTIPTRFGLLATPGFAVAMAVMLLNDLVLKATFHNALTGKLSDFSGVFVFCLFLIACCPRLAWCGCLLGAALFAWWKTPWSAPVISAWNQLGW
jgi:hypothetical protein